MATSTRMGPVCHRGSTTSAQCGDDSWDDLEGAVDVGLRGAIPQREAEGTCRQVGSDAHGGEDVTRLEGTAGARRPARDADALLAEGDEELFPFDARHAQVQMAGKDVDAFG